MSLLGDLWGGARGGPSGGETSRQVPGNVDQNSSALRRQNLTYVPLPVNIG